MEEGSRITKDRGFIYSRIKDRSMNTILLLYLDIRSKSSAFGIRGSSGRREDFVSLSPKGGWLCLDQDLLGL
jgi:hypothetical protein